MQFNKFIVREPAALSRWEARMALKDRVRPAILIGFLFIIMINVPADFILALSGFQPLIFNSEEMMSIYSGNMEGAINAVKVMLPAVSASFIFLLLISGPFRLSRAMFYVRYRRRQEAETSMIFYGFNYFGKALGTQFLIFLLIFAWTMLIYVPGIFIAVVTMTSLPDISFQRVGAAMTLGGLISFLTVVGSVVMMIAKMLQYSQAFFLIADHPQMKSMEAIRASKYLMNGNRGKLFFLNFSFIGWYILAYMVGMALQHPFTSFIEGAGLTSSYGGQVFAMIIGTLATGLAFGFLDFYNGVANAVFYEKARGLAPGMAIPPYPSSSSS